MKVSIITIVLNGEKTIEQTIQSVLNQSYPNIEYIIIDGLSSDKTMQIVEKYRNRIDHILSEKDDGVFDAMNKGFAMAQGDVVGYINGGDWYSENAIESIVKAFSQNEVDVVYGKTVNVFPSGHLTEMRNGCIEDISFRMPFSHPSSFIRRSAIVDKVLFDKQYKIAADYDLFLKLYYSNNKFLEINENIAYFRIGGISTTNLVECANEVKSIALSRVNESDAKIKDKINNYSKARIIDADTKKKMDMIVRKGAKQDSMLTRKKLFIWGAGYRGIEALLFLTSLGYEIEGFIDNNRSKWGEKIGNTPIQGFSAQMGNSMYIIAVMNYQQEIVHQLDMQGYIHEKDYILFSELVDDLLDEIGIE